jgi:hypothetical protein
VESCPPNEHLILPKQASEADVRILIREAVQATLGRPSQANLAALDAEGRRRTVRCCVEKVVLGPEGTSVVLTLGPGTMALTNKARLDSPWAC